MPESSKDIRPVSVHINGKRVFPPIEQAGPMSMDELLDVARRPMILDERIEAFHDLNWDVAREIVAERQIVDANTGLMNRAFWDAFPIAECVLLVDVGRLVEHLVEHDHAILVDAVAVATGRALREAMDRTRQSVHAYRLSLTRFGVQCLVPDQDELVVEHMKKHLADIEIRQCKDGTCHVLRGIKPKFVYAQTYEDALRGLDDGSGTGA